VRDIRKNVAGHHLAAFHLFHAEFSKTSGHDYLSRFGVCEFSGAAMASRNEVSYAETAGVLQRSRRNYRLQIPPN
jgi:hypothetical protein